MDRLTGSLHERSLRLLICSAGGIVILRGANFGRGTINDDDLSLLDAVLDSLVLLGWRRPVSAPWLTLFNICCARHIVEEYLDNR